MNIYESIELTKLARRVSEVVAARIRDGSLGWSQQRIADQVGVHQGTVSRYLKKGRIHG